LSKKHQNLKKGTHPPTWAFFSFLFQRLLSARSAPPSRLAWAGAWAEFFLCGLQAWLSQTLSLVQACSCSSNFLFSAFCDSIPPCNFLAVYRSCGVRCRIHGYTSMEMLRSCALSRSRHFDKELVEWLEAQQN
jgi:hypothetical protein